MNDGRSSKTYRQKWAACGYVYKPSLRRYYPDQVLAPAAPGAKGMISARYIKAPLVRTAKIVGNVVITNFLIG